MLHAFVLLLVLLPGPARADSGMLLASVANRQMPLDVLPAPARAYSFRRLRTAYTANKAVNVIRASDSATMDIGFSPDGSPDITTLATFLAATTGKIVTCYDQSGGANNLTQAVDANRPGVALVALSPWPALQTTSGTIALGTAANFPPTTGLLSLSVIANRTVGTAAASYLQANTTNNTLQGTGSANSWRMLGGGSGFNVAATDAVWHAGLSIHNGASSILRVDATEGTGTTILNTTASITRIIGAAATTVNEVEAILWDNYGLTIGERVYLTNNQRIFGKF